MTAAALVSLLLSFKCLKKNSARILAAAAAAVMLLFLAACTQRIRQFPDSAGSGEKTDSGNGRSANARALELLPAEPVRVGFAQAGHESDWRTTVTRLFRETFREENGFALYVVDADGSPKAQIAAVRNFIREGLDYIIIAPIVETGWDAVLTEAEHARIPVILVDRMIACDGQRFAAWVGPDFVLEGEWAGRWLQNYLGKTGRDSGEIRIVAINGTPGSSTQLGRTQGFAKYVAANKNWKLLAQESGDFTEAGGRKTMEGYLRKFSDIDVVICQSDNEAIGACAAMEEAGVSYGRDGGVIVISFDAANIGLQAVLDGKIHADFGSSPLLAPYAADIIQKLETGGTPAVKKNYMVADGFTFEENPMMQMLPSGMKKMIRVTKEIIKNR